MTPGARVRKVWLLYALAAVAASLVVLSIYVNTYDDYDVGDRLRGVGGFARQAMTALSFPLGPTIGLLADPALERAFGCGGDANDPCAIFVMWNTHFAALVAQIALLRWALGRRR